jgi:FtsH-binding integral membrane protein
VLDQVQILAEGIPDVDTGVDLGNLTPYLYKGIAALIIVAVVLAIFRAIPKWVLLLAVIVLLAVAGYIKVQ